MVWGCEGISLSSSDTVSLPPVSPRSWNERPGPWPGCIGALPCMSGSAKVDLPSPPYVVPSNENSAVFCDIGSIWPSHHAQPLGAKLNGKILISATNGSAIKFSLSCSWLLPVCQSGLTWENTEQRDNKIDAEVRLKVGMGLTASNRRNCRRV